MPKRFELLVFDWDGTLMDSAAAIIASIQLSCSDLGLPVPERERAAHVEIELNDGRVLTHFQPTRKGDPELPLTDDEVNDKYLELAAPVIGDATARKLLEALRSLEKSASVEFDFASAARARLSG